jgi:hypothetical protein
MGIGITGSIFRENIAMDEDGLAIAYACRARGPGCYKRSRLWEPLKFRWISPSMSAAEIR